MAWEVHYFDTRKKKNAVAADLSTKEMALRYACTLEAEKCLVRLIDGPGERIKAYDVVEWCNKHWSGTKNPSGKFGFMTMHLRQGA